MDERRLKNLCTFVLFAQFGPGELPLRFAMCLGDVVAIGGTCEKLETYFIM